MAHLFVTNNARALLWDRDNLFNSSVISPETSSLSDLGYIQESPIFNKIKDRAVVVFWLGILLTIVTISVMCPIIVQVYRR
jgi:hypothetical protein